MKTSLKVLGLVLTAVAVATVWLVFRNPDDANIVEKSEAAMTVAKDQRVLENAAQNAALEQEVRAIKSTLSTELTSRLQGVSDDERAAVAARFREDFSKDLAREQETEDRIQDAQPSRPDPVFTEKRDEILSIAELIRAGHSVEEAERIHAEKQG